MTIATQVYLSPERKKEVVELSAEKFSRTPNWLTFFREVMGLDGIVRRAFPTQEEFVAFEKTEEYNEVQKMVMALRALKKNPPLNEEPTRVITVRLPKSIHEALRAEANDHDVSMNWLCIAKLLQKISEDALPKPKSHARHQKVAIESVRETVSQYVPATTSYRMESPVGYAGSAFIPDTPTNPNNATSASTTLPLNPASRYFDDL